MNDDELTLALNKLNIGFSRLPAHRAELSLPENIDFNLAEKILPPDLVKLLRMTTRVEHKVHITYWNPPKDTCAAGHE